MPAHKTKSAVKTHSVEDCKHMILALRSGLQVELLTCGDPLPLTATDSPDLIIANDGVSTHLQAARLRICRPAPAADLLNTYRVVQQHACKQWRMCVVSTVAALSSTAGKACRIITTALSSASSNLSSTSRGSPASKACTEGSKCSHSL